MKILLVVCFFYLFSLGRTGEAQDDTPFLYYYSDDLRTFVVERADGTDSRVLSQVVMPSDTTGIQISGWSPSGEWLSWISTESLPNGNTRRSVWVANIDGVQSLELLDQIDNAYQATWSPVEDLLFLSELGRTSDTISNEMMSTRHFFLIDAQNQSILTTFEMETSPIEGSYAIWRANGDYVTFEYSINTENGSTSFIRQISHTGDIEDIPIPRSLESTIKMVTQNPSDNWLLRGSEDLSQIIAVNAISGERIEFESPATINHVFLYQWNYAVDHALIYVRTPRSGDEFELWLLSIPARTLQSVALEVNNFSGEGGSWFPWSFYANSAVFYADEGLFALEIEPEVQITEIISARSSYSSPQWYPIGNRLYFATSTEDSMGNWLPEHYIYDFLTHTLAGQEDPLFPDRTSQSARYTVVVNPLAIIDRDQEQIINIPQDSRRQSSYYDLENIIWY